MNSSLLCLALCCILVQSQKHASSFQNEIFTSNFIKVTPDSEIFYWHFESRSSYLTDPLIFFIQGNGFSTIPQVFQGVGPYTIEKNLTLSMNPYSWNNKANLVFVDQPVGTGFSHAQEKDLPTSYEQSAEYFILFLKEFYSQHPQYQKRNTYIIGQSCGGLLSVISKSILMKNLEEVTLTGIGFFGGEVNSQIQIESFVEYGIKNNLFINDGLKEEAVQDLQKYQLKIKQAKSDNVLRRQYTKEYFFSFLSKTKKINPFNINEDSSKIKDYLVSKQFREYFPSPQLSRLLSVFERQFVEYNHLSANKLENEEIQDFSGNIEFCLEKGINIFVAYGNLDFFENHIGGQRWVEGLKWKHSQEFFQEKQKDYSVDGKVVGVLKRKENLSFYVFNSAGYSIYKEQPSIALNLISEYIK